MRTGNNFYGFTARNWKMKLAGFPQEDSYAFDRENKIAVVSDGVTRDFIDGSVVRRDLSSLIKCRTGKYPNHAQNAAQDCTKYFLKTQSLSSCNSIVGFYNSKTFKEIDYLGNDFAGCTAAGTFEEGDFLNWQFISDSGVAILDRNGNLKFKTSNEGPNSKGSIDAEIKRKYNSGFNEQKGRKIIRSLYRNNPEEPLAYGVLTGEQNALNYIRKGKEKLDEGDYILLYTDGVGDILFKDENHIDQNILVSLRVGKSELENICEKRVSTEGTLVVYQKPVSYPSCSVYSMVRDQKMLCDEDFFGRPL